MYDKIFAENETWNIRQQWLMPHCLKRCHPKDEPQYTELPVPMVSGTSSIPSVRVIAFIISFFVNILLIKNAIFCYVSVYHIQKKMSRKFTGQQKNTTDMHMSLVSNIISIPMCHSGNDLTSIDKIFEPNHDENPNKRKLQKNETQVNHLNKSSSPRSISISQLNTLLCLHP